MKTQLHLIMGISLLLAICLVMGSYLVIYHHDYAVEAEDVDVLSKEYKNGVLTLRVSSDLAGEFLYSVEGEENEDGNYELTFYGGKQPALAQTPGNSEAVFAVEIPAGYARVVCGNTTLYSIS